MLPLFWGRLPFMLLIPAFVSLRQEDYTELKSNLNYRQRLSQIYRNIHTHVSDVFCLDTREKEKKRDGGFIVFSKYSSWR